VRVNVRVYPGSRRVEAGGRYGTAEPPVLVVRVTARAIDGRANAAVIAAVADAFEVRPRGVRILAGDSSRNKVIEVDGADPMMLAVVLARG
jgi:uncharacterized protein YggU (UPF0235/DUF167 family)